jgi:hypothetical protein
VQELLSIKKGILFKANTKYYVPVKYYDVTNFKMYKKTDLKSVKKHNVHVVSYKSDLLFNEFGYGRVNVLPFQDHVLLWQSEIEDDSLNEMLEKVSGRLING